ncbi:MAG: FoF1 ATP synthase subunit delta/epsilon [Gemmiger formicilis]
MATFPLKIMTPDGVAFDGAVTSVSCRTINGQLQLLARHIDICTALGMGEAHIKLEDGTVRRADLYGRYAEHAWRRVPSAGNDL